MIHLNQVCGEAEKPATTGPLDVAQVKWIYAPQGSGRSQVGSDARSPPRRQPACGGRLGDDL
jgi:hypothetical protein